MVFNPVTNSYVDRHLFERVMGTPDVDPNRSKNNKKLTTVLSKNQKLSSFNDVEITAKFEKKVNFEKEMERLQRKFRSHQETSFIKNNETAFRAIFEGQRVETYFEDQN